MCQNVSWESPAARSFVYNCMKLSEYYDEIFLRQGITDPIIKGKKGVAAVWKIERIWSREAEKLTGEKAHVLRYWEDELGMEIHRNSLGHRCYTAQDIQIFLGIRELKKKGASPESDPRADAELVQATAEIKAFPAEAAETAKEKRIRQYREKRTKCRRWLSIFCPSGKQNSWRTL